ncbi:hypothetical protein [Flintibacter muris]|uniref:hypothetical protein n=1 Tax=Flintibacter muris TaxID=2941327 RepID=UPI0020421CF8|nr:hypothetical protein [Flintibacter muris]
MGKITKKSINAVLDIYKRNSGDTVLKLGDPDNGDSIVMEIALKTSLTISEKGIFVDRVVTPCFDENGDFMPQYLDPLFMIALLQMTTNVPPIEDTIPILDEVGNETGEKSTIMNIEKTYELCKAINLVKNVADTKYQALIEELRQMAADKLAYMKDVNARKATSFGMLLKPYLDAAGNEANISQEALTRISNAIEEYKPDKVVTM